MDKNSKDDKELIRHMINLIIYQYFRINAKEIWNIVWKDLLQLEKKLKQS